MSPMRLFTALSLLLALPFSLAATIPHTERRDACGNITNAYNFRRMYNDAAKDHFYTISIFDEIEWSLSNNYTIQDLNTALIFRFPTEATSLVPLYRLYQPATQTHLYTIDATFRQTLIANSQPPYIDEGSSDEFADGAAGYVYRDGSCPGTVPLLWASNSLITDNYYTIDTAEYNSFVANGYTPKGTVAWVYPVPSNLAI